MARERAPAPRSAPPGSTIRRRRITLKGETHPQHSISIQDRRRRLPAVLQSGRCGLLGDLWSLRHQRYDRRVSGPETARREQNRRCPGQSCGHLFRGLLCNPARPLSPFSGVDVDLGRTDCRNQTYQSGIGAGHLQTILLPAHQSQQADRSSAFHCRSCDVMVHCSPRHRGRCRHIRLHSGRAFYPS